MHYEIVELEPYSGNEAKIYSIIPEGEDKTLFDRFVDEFQSKYKDEILDIIKRLTQIGKTTGARSSFFKQYEGKYGDFVCALYDLPEKNLRIYCMRFGMQVIILGGGGYKPKSINSWQEDPDLSNEANKMIDYAADILKRLDSGDLYWSADKREIEGNLKNYGDEEAD